MLQNSLETSLPSHSHTHPPYPQPTSPLVLFCRLLFWFLTWEAFRSRLFFFSKHNSSNTSNIYTLERESEHTCDSAVYFVFSPRKQKIPSRLSYPWTLLRSIDIRWTCNAHSEILSAKHPFSIQTPLSYVLNDNNLSEEAGKPRWKV